MNRVSIGFLSLLIGALSGCMAISDPPRLVAAPTTDSSSARIGLWNGGQTMLVATTRQASTSSDAAYFTGTRGDFSAARTTLFPPQKAFLSGMNPIESRDWTLAGVTAMAGDSPGHAIATAAKGRDVLVYVHGFNESFESAATSYAGFLSGIDFAGAPVLFTWPSRGAMLDYVYDRESAMASRDALEETLLALADEPGVGRVHILAHSLGAMVALEALRSIRDRRGSLVTGRFGAIVLANPDVDLDVFRQQVKRIGELAAKMTVIISTNDRALELSRQLAGGIRRVGAADREALIATGVQVVDATPFSQGLIRHSTFLSSPDVAGVIARAIETAN